MGEMKVLAIRLGALGDVANCFHAVRGLKEVRPDIHLTWMVEEGSVAIVRANADVDDIIVLPRKRWQRRLWNPFLLPLVPHELYRFMRDVRRRRFDVLLDFQGHLKSGLIGRMSGVKRRIGFTKPFCRENNQWFTTEHVALPSKTMLRAEKALALVRALAPEAQCAAPDLRATDEDAAFAEALVHRLRHGGYLVGMHPGSSAFGSFKRWPVDRFASVARQLAEQGNARTLITWGPGEEELAERLEMESAGTATAAPPMSLGQLMAVLRRLDLYIAADTGPMHLAAALGQSVVAIYGPKDPRIYGPYGCPAEIVRKDMDCSPCTLRKCDHVSCIMEIPPEDVTAAALRLLD